MIITKDNMKDKNMSSPERWISSALGSLLLVRALTRKKGKLLFPVLMAVGGAELIRWGISGKGLIHNAFGINTAVKGKGPMASVKHGGGIKHIKNITIDQTPEEVFRFWRNFENLPRFMEHLKEVKITGANTSHWIVKGPAGTTVEWDAVIHNEIPNKLIAWRSVESSDVNNAGSVEFNPVREGQATELKIEISYEPPAGKIGATVAKLFGEEPGQQLEDDLRHLKHLLETRLTSKNEPAIRH
jgi:Predicted integral membrane protein